MESGKTANRNHRSANNCRQAISGKHSQLPLINISMFMPLTDMQGCGGTCTSTVHLSKCMYINLHSAICLSLLVIRSYVRHSYNRQLAKHIFFSGFLSLTSRCIYMNSHCIVSGFNNDNQNCNTVSVRVHTVCCRTYYCIPSEGRLSSKYLLIGKLMIAVFRRSTFCLI